MRKLSSLGTFWGVVVATLAVWELTTAAQQPAIRPTVTLPHVAGEILVKFRTTAPRGRRSDVVAALGARVLRHFDVLDIEHLALPTNVAVEGAVQRLRADANVLSVQPNYIRHATATSPPNDPYWTTDALWGLQKISVNAAWTNFTRGDGSVVIANIDTGVNYNHPDLAANMWRNPGEIPGNGIDDDGDGYVDDVYGIDVVNGDSDPLDDNGHGTHTAGTAAAIGNNGVGVVGVNWNAKILACKFLDANGNGTDSGAITCFNYIVVLKNRGINIRVSSNSWGQQRDLNQAFPTVLKNAIDAAGDAGILNVFAAGNTGTNNDTTPFDPASFTSPSVVAVAASDAGDNPASFSNYGATSVHIAAPGVSILSTYGNAYGYLSGTSMAVPHVSGAAALLAALTPAATVSALKGYLLDNVDKLGQWTGTVASGGRLNVFAAALAAANNTPTTAGVTPFGGSPWSIPGTIEAENFDLGGQGVAYYDTTAGNAYGAYRSTDVDIEVTSDTNGGYDVAKTRAGEWLRYSVDVTSANTYAIDMRVANVGAGAKLHVEVDGVDQTGPIAVPDTGGWQAWQTITTNGIAFTAGAHSVRVVFDAVGAGGGVGNFNWFRFSSPSTPPQPPNTAYGGTPVALPGYVQAENYDVGGQGVAYNDTTAGNTGNVYRFDDVDIGTTSDPASGGYYVGWTRVGEWIKYTVNATTTRSYAMNVRVANVGTGAQFRIEVDGTDVTGPVTMPNTGGWDVWQTIALNGTTLAQGSHVVRLVMTTHNAENAGVGNFGYIGFQ